MQMDFMTDREIFTGWDDLDEADEKLQEGIREYRIVQYNYLFDEKNRKDDHFQLSGTSK